MKSLFRRPASLGAGLVVLALSGACQRPPSTNLVTFSGPVMGTQFNVRLVAPDLEPEARQALESRVNHELTSVDDLMTTYRDSEVTRFNEWRSNSPFAVSPATAEVVAVSLELSAATGGALDITIAPLVEALGFGAAPPPAAGPRPDVEALYSRVGYRRLSVDAEGRLVKQIPELAIDLSAIAKGFAVDRAANALDQMGIDNYMVEVGGELRVKGLNERGALWRLGIERPTAAANTNSRQTQRIVSLADLSMATSGDYRNYREIDGRRVSHILDPRSGNPIQHNVASATVLHPDCATADGLATAMMVLGEAGLDLAESRGWAVLLLARQEDRFVELETSAFSRLVESTEPGGP